MAEIIDLRNERRERKIPDTSYFVRVDMYHDGIAGEVLDLGDDLDADNMRVVADHLATLSRWLRDQAGEIDPRDEEELLAESKYKEPEALVKLGGIPDWIQDEEHPSCVECGNLMVFVSQINSDETVVRGSRVLMFGDVGRLYTFVCCNMVTSIMQCY